MASNAALQADNSWRIALLSNGKQSVEQKLAEVGRWVMAGQEIPLLHIIADQRRYGSFDDFHDFPTSGVFANELSKAAATCYGTAGPAFVRDLIDGIGANQTFLGALERTLERLIPKSVEGFDLTREGQTVRAVERFALIGLAGELATQFRITGWALGEASAAAREGFRLWLEERDHVREDEFAITANRVRRYFVSHGSERFGTEGASHVGRRTVGFTMT